LEHKTENLQSWTFYSDFDNAQLKQEEEEERLRREKEERAAPKPIEPDASLVNNS
jgi:hypothetical protein